jgi:RND family efflux transporter MFP subunit
VSVIAPEIAVQIAESESRVQTAESALVEAQARLAAVAATYERLKKASETPGAIAGNELVVSEKSVEAARASVKSAENATRTAQAAVRTVKQLEEFLQVTAPFPGAITERYVHPGALVGPGSGSAGALLELEQVSRLRLVVPVPESEVAGVRLGTRVQFRVPAHPTRTFSGTVARIDRSLDPKTRTMAVELDVQNPRNELSPGMFPEVAWPARRAGASLLVPPTAVVTTTERTFVVRIAGDRAEWVNVRKGAAAGDLIEVIGPLAPGDLVVRRANDEMRQGTRIQIRKTTGT